jgi:hypothetical protein
MDLVMELTCLHPGATKLQVSDICFPGRIREACLDRTSFNPIPASINDPSRSCDRLGYDQGGFTSFILECPIAVERRVERQAAHFRSFSRNFVLSRHVENFP